MTPQSCIDEINSDLKRLNADSNVCRAEYLAGRISQKINVLVHLCQMRQKKTVQAQPAAFGVQAINTRQQWLRTLEENCLQLSAQQLALQESVIARRGALDTQALYVFKQSWEK